MKATFTILVAALLGVASKLPALEFPNWAGFTSGVTPQTIVFTNHGTLTVSNATGMATGYPRYFAYGTFNNVPAPFTNTLPAMWPGQTAAYSWSIGFAPPLRSADYILITDVDNLETLTMSAYDPDGQPLNVTQWSMSLHDPILPNAGFKGTVTRSGHQIQITGFNGDVSDELVLLRPAPSQSVGRLDYNYVNRGGGPTITFATDNCDCCPALEIERTAGKVLVSWPASGSNCVLQTTVDLAPAHWTNWPVPPVIQGNLQLNEISSSTPRSRFFRLQRP